METSLTTPTKSGTFKFLAYTSIGLIMFFVKLPLIDSTIFNFVIALGQTITASIIHEILLVFLILNAFLTFMVSGLGWQGLSKHPKLSTTFKCSNFKLLISILAPILVLLSMIQLTPYINQLSAEVIHMCNTIFVFLTLSKVMLPLVSDYGLAEYMEELLNPIMRPIFKLPGIAIMAILTSAFVSVTVAVMLITDQYFKGEYSKREALYLITCLTLPAMSITILLSGLEGFSDQWGLFYSMIALSGIVISIVMARLPLFTKMGDTYYQPDFIRPNKVSKPFKERANDAVIKASNRALSKHDTILGHIGNVLINMTSFLPFIVVLGTLAMFLVHETPVIDLLSKPYGAYLNLLGLKDAFVLAPALFISTIDIVLPSIVLIEIPDIQTRMVMQVILLTQITYMAPVLLLLNIPGLTKPIKVLKIYLIRAVIVAPVVILFSKFLL